MRRALGDAWDLLLAFFGGGDAANPDRVPAGRWGALHLAVQTVFVVVVVTVFFALRQWVTERPLFGPPALLMAFLALLPVALHWFARPVRRWRGALAGAVTAGLLGSVAVLVVGAPDGLVATALVVGVPLVLGAAVFGRLSPKDFPPADDVR